MSMKDEADAYELGKRLFNDNIGHVVSFREQHNALITSGLPVTIDTIAELQMGYEDTQRGYRCPDPS